MGRAQLCPKSFLRIELGLLLSVCLFLSQGFQECWGPWCPWKGEGLSLQRPRMPAGPGPASEAAAPLPSRLVCIKGEVFSKLLLLSAPFPSKNGQSLPAVCGQIFWSRAQIWGGFVALLMHAWPLSGCSAWFT